MGWGGHSEWWVMFGAALLTPLQPPPAAHTTCACTVGGPSCPATPVRRPPQRDPPSCSSWGPPSWRARRPRMPPSPSRTEPVQGGKWAGRVEGGQSLERSTWGGSTVKTAGTTEGRGSAGPPSAVSLHRPAHLVGFRLLEVGGLLLVGQALPGLAGGLANLAQLQVGLRLLELPGGTSSSTGIVSGQCVRTVGFIDFQRAGCSTEQAAYECHRSARPGRRLKARSHDSGLKQQPGGARSARPGSPTPPAHLLALVRCKEHVGGQGALGGVGVCSSQRGRGSSTSVSRLTAQLAGRQQPGPVQSGAPEARSAAWQQPIAVRGVHPGRGCLFGPLSNMRQRRAAGRKAGGWSGTAPSVFGAAVPARRAGHSWIAARWSVQPAGQRRSSPSRGCKRCAAGRLVDRPAAAIGSLDGGARPGGGARWCGGAQATPAQMITPPLCCCG